LRCNGKKGLPKLQRTTNNTVISKKKSVTFN
jgi:hypothetical protein